MPKSLYDDRAQPEELAPAYVVPASSDVIFITGELVEVTGDRLSSSL